MLLITNKVTIGLAINVFRDLRRINYNRKYDPKGLYINNSDSGYLLTRESS